MIIELLGLGLGGIVASGIVGHRVGKKSVKVKKEDKYVINPAPQGNYRYLVKREVEGKEWNAYAGNSGEECLKVIEGVKVREEVGKMIFYEYGLIRETYEK